MEETAINTAALLLSGVLLAVARRNFGRDPGRARKALLGSILLGAFFVVFQGAEWVALIGQGLTLTSSSLGSFFYLIIGMHALHAIVALGVLIYTWQRLRRGWLASSQPGRGRGVLVLRGWPVADSLPGGVPVRSVAKTATALPAALLGAALLWAPQASRACAVCMSGTEDATRLAFILTTALLTFLPLGIVGGLVWWLRRRAREIEEAPVSAEVAPR